MSRKQEELLALYDAGSLLAEANRLTRMSGNGRLRRSDGSSVNIGGSTGGHTRTVLDDWQAPDVAEFDPVSEGAENERDSAQATFLSSPTRNCCVTKD